MTKKHWISVKRGLSEDPKHRQAIGEALWLFLHIIDAADWETGMVYDWRDKDIAIDMSLSTATVRGWRERLRDNGYITCIQKQHGLELIIHNWIDPRNYSGKKLNARQGDMDDSPSIQDDMDVSPSISEKEPECAQVVPQGDTQVHRDPIVNPTSFIESTSTLTSTSKEDITKKSLADGYWQTILEQIRGDRTIPMLHHARLSEAVPVSMTDHTLLIQIDEPELYNARFSKSLERNIFGALVPGGKIVFQKG